MADDPFPHPQGGASRDDLLSSLAAEVHVWVIDPDASSEDVCTWCEGVLSAEESERRRKFLHEADGRSFLLAHGLVRAVLSRYAIVVLAFAIALDQLGIDREFLITSFLMLSGAFALAVALAVGLGARETVAKYLDDRFGKK